MSDNKNTYIEFIAQCIPDGSILSDRERRVTTDNGDDYDDVDVDDDDIDVDDDDDDDDDSDDDDDDGGGGVCQTADRMTCTCLNPLAILICSC